MNKIIICGRLTKDPEIRSTSGGSSVARYSLAVDRRFKKDGDPSADFFDCVAFGKAAEFAEKYLQKGTKMLVTGRMEQNNYTNKDGQKVYSWTLIVEEQEFAESKKAAEENGRPAPKSTGDRYVDIADGIEEDLPFI